MNLSQMRVIITFLISLMSFSWSRQQRSLNASKRRQKIHAFVITLPTLRPNAFHDFNSSWHEVWPELELHRINGVYHNIRGHGLTMGFIVALEQALYIYNADHAIFFEDDARPFKSIKKMLGPTFTYGQYFLYLLKRWEMLSPTLFLGGHGVQNLEPPNSRKRVTNIKKCSGSYSIVVRKRYFLPLAEYLREVLLNAVDERRWTGKAVCTFGLLLAGCC